MIGGTCSLMAIYLAGVIKLSTERMFNEYLAEMIAAWAYSAVILVLFFLLFNLILLHIYLRCKGMTTYQMVVAMR